MRATRLAAILVVLDLGIARSDLVLNGTTIQINSETLLAAEVFPSVGALPNGDFVVTWSENIEFSSGNRPLRAEVMARRFNNSGEALGSEILVNSFTTGWQGWPVVDTWPGGFVIVWESDPMSGGNPQFGGVRRYDAAGAPLGEEARFSDTANDPVVATHVDGGFAVVWSTQRGLLARRFDSGGVPLGDAELVADGGDAYFPAVAMLVDGRSVVAFQTFDPAGIATQLFDQSGVPMSDMVRVSDGERGTAPELVNQPNGGFFVIWGGSRGLVGRRFTGTGQAIADEFVLTTHSIRHGFPGPRYVASDPDGGFVLVQTETRCDKSGIVARQFDSAGSPVGDPLLVRDYATTDQFRPSVAADHAGGYIVVWTDLQNTTSYAGAVHGQRLLVEPPGSTPLPQLPTPTCPPTPAIPTATATPVSTRTRTSTPTRCPGDCDGNRQVTISELIVGVRILLEEMRALSCSAADADRDGRVTVSDLVRAVGSAVRGCEAPRVSTDAVAYHPAPRSP